MSLSHNNLVAWQRADDLFLTLHRLTHKTFPAFERFELGSQLRRAAFSVAVNIVEGIARPQGRGRLHFLNISQSSLAEVDYCIHVAQRLGYVSEELAASLQVTLKQVGAPLAGLIRSERSKLFTRVAGAVLLIVYLTARLA